MALDVRSLETDEPPKLHVVSPTPQAVVDDPIGEEFGFPQNRKAVAVRTPRAPRTGRRRRLLPFLVILCVGAAGLFVVRTLGAGDDAPEPDETQTSAAAATTAPSAPVAAPAQPASVRMSVLSSRIVPAAPQTYRASVAVRNPTDVPAADVTVTVTLKDAGGNVVRTDTRTIEVLPSGQTVDVEFTGEFQAGTAAPSALDVQATAARLISPSV